MIVDTLTLYSLVDQRNTEVLKSSCARIPYDFTCAFLLSFSPASRQNQGTKPEASRDSFAHEFFSHHDRQETDYERRYEQSLSKITQASVLVPAVHSLVLGPIVSVDEPHLLHNYETPRCVNFRKTIRSVQSRAMQSSRSSTPFVNLNLLRNLSRRDVRRQMQ